MEKASKPRIPRRVPRIDADFPVILNFDKKRSYCRARQLSDLGMLVTPSQNNIIGAIVRIDLLPELPNRKLCLSGIVAYSIDSGTGIRFTEIRSEQQST